MHLQLMRHPRTCAPNQYTLPSQYYPQKSISSKSQLRSKQSSNGPSPENFETIGGCFECYMYRVMVLGWLRKKEEGKERKEEGR